MRSPIVRFAVPFLGVLLLAGSSCISAAHEPTREASQYGGQEAACAGTLLCPKEDVVVTRGFGAEVNSSSGTTTERHTAVDIDGRENETIKASCNGTIVYTGFHSGYASWHTPSSRGPLLMQQCDLLTEDALVLYGHCVWLQETGSYVRAGEPICTLSSFEGPTAGSDWSHLHWGLWLGVFDPKENLTYIRGYVPDADDWQLSRADPTTWVMKQPGEEMKVRYPTDGDVVSQNATAVIWWTVPTILAKKSICLLIWKGSKHDGRNDTLVWTNAGECPGTNDGSGGFETAASVFAPGTNYYVSIEDDHNNVLSVGGYFTVQTEGICLLAAPTSARFAPSTAACGDGCCSTGETSYSCAPDCPAGCGDHACGPGEDASTCAVDCATWCGDGLCTGTETAKSCNADCPSVCGDAACTGAENASSCIGDCPAACGDGYCSAGESPSSCARDCASAEVTDYQDNDGDGLVDENVRITIYRRHASNGLNPPAAGAQWDHCFAYSSYSGSCVGSADSGMTYRADGRNYQVYSLTIGTTTTVAVGPVTLTRLAECYNGTKKEHQYWVKDSTQYQTLAGAGWACTDVGYVKTVAPAGLDTRETRIRRHVNAAITDTMYSDVVGEGAGFGFTDQGEAWFAWSAP